MPICRKELSVTALLVKAPSKDSQILRCRAGHLCGAVVDLSMWEVVRARGAAKSY